MQRKGWVRGLGDCTVLVDAKDIYGYGKKIVTWPDGSKTVSKVHRLVLMVHFKTLGSRHIYPSLVLVLEDPSLFNRIKQTNKIKTLDVPTVDFFGEQLDISHLCHTRLCINPLNLPLEKHSVNMSRTHCQKAGVYTMAHELACIF